MIEQSLVEQFVTQPAVEQFHERVLHRFARRDAMPINLPLLCPAQDRGRDQLRQPFARELVDNAQDVDAPAARKGVRYEVETSALVAPPGGSSAAPKRSNNSRAPILAG
jgi:hypothetical protein